MEVQLVVVLVVADLVLKVEQVCVVVMDVEQLVDFGMKLQILHILHSLQYHNSSFQNSNVGLVDSWFPEFFMKFKLLIKLNIKCIFTWACPLWHLKNLVQSVGCPKCVGVFESSLGGHRESGCCAKATERHNKIVIKTFITYFIFFNSRNDLLKKTKAIL
jgi:hypothetical protein